MAERALVAVYADTVAAEGHTATIRAHLWLVRKVFVAAAALILALTVLSYRDYVSMTYTAMTRSKSPCLQACSLFPLRTHPRYFFLFLSSFCYPNNLPPQIGEPALSAN